jgi:hypothetical protein
VRFLKQLFAVGLAAALAACASSKVPIGTANGPVDDARLVGTWMTTDPEHPENRMIAYGFAGKTAGTMQGLFVIPPGQHEKPGWGSFDVVVGRIGNVGFLNVREITENGEAAREGHDQAYTPAMYTLDADTLTVRVLDYERIKEAIAKGEIVGEGGTISAAQPALDAYIGAHIDALFGGKPTVFHRVRP